MALHIDGTPGHAVPWRPVLGNVNLPSYIPICTAVRLSNPSTACRSAGNQRLTKTSAIRMHTPSGRFQPSTRLCLSMSDFHPKTFNPAWEVSTILMGLLSFMTSEEMTTGSLRATERERKLFAGQTRWWNSTCGGSTPKTIPGISGSNASGKGNVKAGDGGAKFKAQWPQLDEENWTWMKEHRIDPATGKHVPDPKASSCAPGATAALRRHSGGLGSVVEGGQNAREASQGWIWSQKLPIAFGVLIVWVVFARIMSDGGEV